MTLETVVMVWHDAEEKLDMVWHNAEENVVMKMLWGKSEKVYQN